MVTAVVVTGASRSFGRCLALEFAREVDTESLDLVCGPRSHAGRFSGAF
jgi:NAD(P)-dependent dehydrogenase (short-subunit alcohol dehydrogenase family)